MNKLRLFVLVILGLTALVLVMNCSKASDQQVADAQENAVEAQEDAVEAQADADAAVAENLAWKDWQNFKKDVEAVIAANEKIIANYKALMTDASGKMRVNYNKNIDILEAKNKALKARLAAYKDDGKTSWEIFAREFKKDMDELGTALKGFAN